MTRKPLPQHLLRSTWNTVSRPSSSASFCARHTTSVPLITSSTWWQGVARGAAKISQRPPSCGPTTAPASSRRRACAAPTPSSPLAPPPFAPPSGTGWQCPRRTPGSAPDRCHHRAPSCPQSRGTSQAAPRTCTRRLKGGPRARRALAGEGLRRAGRALQAARRSERFERPSVFSAALQPAEVPCCPGALRSKASALAQAKPGSLYALPAHRAL
jgi:hypothetical protein